MIDPSKLQYNPILLSEEKMSELINYDKISIQATSTIQEGWTGFSWIKLHWNSVTNIERALLRPDAYDCCHNWSDKDRDYEFDGYLVWFGDLDDAPDYIKKIYEKIKDSQGDAGQGEMDDNFVDITNDNDTWQGFNSGWLKQAYIKIEFKKNLLYKCKDFFLPVAANASTLAFVSTCLNSNEDQYDFIYKEYYDRIQLIQDNFFPWNATFTIGDVISAYNANCSCWDVDPFYWTYNHYNIFTDFNKKSDKTLDLKLEYKTEDDMCVMTITSDVYEKSDKIQLFWKWMKDLSKFDSVMSINNYSIYYQK